METRIEWFTQLKVVLRPPCVGLAERKWSQDSDTWQVTGAGYLWSVVPLGQSWRWTALVLTPRAFWGPSPLFPSRGTVLVGNFLWKVSVMRLHCIFMEANGLKKIRIKISKPILSESLGCFSGLSREQVETFIRSKQCIFSSNVLSLSLGFAFLYKAQQTWKENDFLMESYNFKQSYFTSKEY